MLSAYGWVVVRSSRDRYTDQTSIEDLDELDEQIKLEDCSLWARLRLWLDTEADPWFKWQLSVWRILQGKVEEFPDPFLSPYVPNINPTFTA